MHLMFVALGGALGASLRHLAGHYSLRALGPDFPYSTFFANVTGSFLMGIAIVWLSKHVPGNTELRLFLTTGFLGGFTTFSAFSLDALTLYERGAIGAAAFYVAGSVILSIVAIFLGVYAARTVF